MKREELVRTGSVRLHELYFGNVDWEIVSRRLVTAVGSLGARGEAAEFTSTPG